MEVGDESKAVQARKKIKTAKKRKKNRDQSKLKELIRGSEKEKSRCRTKYNQMLTSDKQ